MRFKRLIKRIFSFQFQVLPFRLHRERGVSILFAVLIMTTILAIGSGISSILIQQTKIMRDIGYSVIALYAADHGVEEVLLMQNPENIPETELSNGAKYEVFVKNAAITPECDAPNFCIKAIGTYKETKRAIEAKY